MIESQIRALFTEIAHGEPAPSQVDIQLARRRGRARLRWRRACVAGPRCWPRPWSRLWPQGWAWSGLGAAAVAAGAGGAAPVQPAGPVPVVRLAARG